MVFRPKTREREDKSIEIVRLQLHPGYGGKLPHHEYEFSHFPLVELEDPRFVNADTGKEVKVRWYGLEPNTTDVIYHPKFPKSTEDRLKSREVNLDDVLKIIPDSSKTLDMICKAIEKSIRTPYTMLNSWRRTNNVGYLLYERRREWVTGAGNLWILNKNHWRETDDKFGCDFAEDSIVREVGIYPIV